MRSLKEHTVHYSKNCKRCVIIDPSFSSFKAVVGKDKTDAANNLSKIIKLYIRAIAGPDVNYEDFNFKMKYTEVTDNEFWLIPNMVCQELYNLTIDKI